MLIRSKTINKVFYDNQKDAIVFVYDSCLPNTEELLEDIVPATAAVYKDIKKQLSSGQEFVDTGD